MSKVADSLLQKARDFARRNDLPRAIESAIAAAQMQGSRVEHWRFLGELQFRVGAHAKACEAFRTALLLDPADAGLFHNLGIVLKREGRIGEAEAMLREAARRQPGTIASTLSLCDMLAPTARRKEAEEMLRALHAQAPTSFEVLRDLTNILIHDARYAEAIAFCESFIQRNGQSLAALEQLSVGYQCIGRLDEALEITGATIAAQPPTSLDLRLASYLSISGRIARLDHRARAQELLGPAIDASLPEDRPASWKDNDTNILRRLAFLFPYYGVSDRALMRVFNGIGDGLAAKIARLPQTKHQPSPKLRVGFVSYNFSEHPIGHLLSPFFEAHAQTGTDLFLYALHLNSFDPNDYAGRIRATTENYRDCRGMGAANLARLIRQDNISILIDLDGYLGGGLPEAFAMRPAPVQIHWLQHLAGMPAPYIDYTIVDRVLVRDDERDNGNGALIRLPDAFQCGDRVALPQTEPSRADHGLPEQVAVYCAFGNWLKIDADVFDCWMEILKGVPDSVLWLSEGPSTKSQDFLRARAVASGISSERLIFAPRVADKATHISRHRCADLFLDTFTFSAATTTTDALWAGLPVLTCPGATAQSRLSASLLRAVGMINTIMRDRRQYITSAIRIGRNRSDSELLKRKLARLLPKSRLYDAPRMVGQFKELYERVWERHASGAPPEHLDISG